MDFRTTFAIALAAAASGRADLSEPAPEWWAPPVPRLDAVARPDAGLPGQPETARPLSDMAIAGGAYTRGFLRLVPGAASTDSVEWARRATRFGLETVVALPGGWSLGLDAVDDQVIHRTETEEARWELARPHGGLRVGAGIDLLERFSPEHDWVWGWSAWVPLLDRTGELEVQTGLRRGRSWRVDAAWATRLVRQKARKVWNTGWEEGIDTTTLRGEETRWSLRVGGQNAAGSALQAWGGVRREADARAAGDDRSVGLASWSVFAGAQGSASRKAWDLNGEARFDLGRDTLALGARDEVRATVEHRLVALQVGLDAPWIGRVRPGLVLSGAQLDLSDGAARGVFPQLPDGIRHDGGGSVRRAGAAASLRVRLPWLDLVPQAGAHRVRVEGDLPQVWSALWPLGEGDAWIGELSGALQWSGPSGSASYTVGWLPVLEGSDRAEPGLSHRFEFRQGF